MATRHERFEKSNNVTISVERYTELVKAEHSFDLLRRALKQCQYSTDYTAVLEQFNDDEGEKT